MNEFRGLKLTTLHSQDDFYGYAHLLVYDEEKFEDAIVGQDIRIIFENHPNTAFLYILAPFSPISEIVKEFLEGTSLKRSKPYLSSSTERFCIITVRSSHGKTEIVSHKIDLSEAKPKLCLATPLSTNLVHGWLFDLFHQHQGKVDAPIGVHFQKGSGKHAEHFLRTANCLLSSTECTAVAFFCIEHVPFNLRRILVDTAPIISVGYSLIKLARAYKLIHSEPTIKSFSSYGGLASISHIFSSDLILLSASTSGSLRKELLEKGAKPNQTITLFYLQSANSEKELNGIICDLTFEKGRSYGYAKIINHTAATCSLCRSGHILAEFEGDQFLLQKRKTTQFRIIDKSQEKSARASLETLTRTGAIRASVNKALSTPFKIDIELVLKIPEIRNKAIKYLRRFCPTPLNLVVLFEIEKDVAIELMEEAGFGSFLATVNFVPSHKLHNQQTLTNGGVLVLFGHLDNHAKARQINATLRQISPNGNIAYLSILTTAKSPEQFSDLKVFLEYGSNGKETFLFRSLQELAISEWSSAWEEELELLRQITSDLSLMDDKISSRKSWIENATTEENSLFLPGKNGELEIKSDFVYLDTKKQKDKISQSDIFFVVINLLTSARNNNRSLGEKRNNDELPKIFNNIYGHRLLSPQNFRDYNDSILRASFLRAANPSEIRYTIDEECSAEISDIIQTEIDGWANGTGEALPEFLIALATKRLQLTAQCKVRIKKSLENSNLPRHLKSIGKSIP